MASSGSMGTTMRLGQTTMLVSVSRMKGSSHSRMGLATRLPPNALPKSSLNRISGGFLHAHW